MERGCFRGLKARHVIAQAGASRRAQAWVNAIKSLSGLQGRHRVNGCRRTGPTGRETFCHTIPGLALRASPWAITWRAFSPWAERRPESGQLSGENIGGTKVFGGTPNTARETRALPIFPMVAAEDGLKVRSSAFRRLGGGDRLKPELQTTAQTHNASQTSIPARAARVTGMPKRAKSQKEMRMPRLRACWTTMMLETLPITMRLPPKLLASAST